jgi:hypothetical protein
MAVSFFRYEENPLAIKRFFEVTKLVLGTEPIKETRR